MRKRRVVKIDEIRNCSNIFQQTKDKTLGVMALVDVENMGYCKDGITRWYVFDMNGEPCIYFKY